MKKPLLNKIAIALCAVGIVIAVFQLFYVAFIVLLVVMTLLGLSNNR